MTMDTARSFIAKHDIDTADGQSIEMSLNNWLFNEKKRGFKAGQFNGLALLVIWENLASCS